MTEGVPVEVASVGGADKVRGGGTLIRFVEKYFAESHSSHPSRSEEGVLGSGCSD